MMEQFKKIISKNLKDYRKKNKITQEDFAEKLEISVEFYGEIEREKKVPSTRLVVKMYHHMGYDYIPLSTDFPSSTNINELFNIVSESPEITDLLLNVARTLKK